MNGILDDSLVGLALLASAGYAVVSLGPRGLRRRMLALLSGAATRAPAFLGLGRAARRLAAASTKTQGACGGCDSCGSEQAPAQKPVGAEVRVPAAEVRVPVSEIGRRTGSTRKPSHVS